MGNHNIVIIGAGVVGLAIFSELAKRYRNVYILEKNANIASETSSRNSGVIHSGIHYKPGSLKASLCVQGNNLLYEICKTGRVNCQKSGKITVARGNFEINKIKQLYQNGLRNGVKGMRLIESEELGKYIPALEGDLGLFTPSTGVIEPKELADFFYSEGLNNGGTFIPNTYAKEAKYENGKYKIKGISGGREFEISSEIVVNAAGLYAHEIAKSLGLDIDRLNYRVRYFKGDYFRIEGKIPFNTLIYPAPQKYGLGIHLTTDVYGVSRLGPNSYEIDSIDYKINSNAQEFIESVSRYYPPIKNYRILEDFAGIRPKIILPNGEGGDFIIREEGQNGYPGFINLIGIDSPGLTSSPAIGKYVADLIGSFEK